MSVLKRNNGQFTALSLAAACGVFITYSVFGYDHGSVEDIRVLVIAGICAVITTWVFWKLLVARGRRILVFRGAVAGALSGLVSIPLFLFAGAFAQASDECPDISCVFNDILTHDSIMDLAIGSVFFSLFGFVVVGPLTISVGVLGGILAVIASGSARQSEGGPVADGPYQEPPRERGRRREH